MNHWRAWFVSYMCISVVVMTVALKVMYQAKETSDAVSEQLQQTAE